MTKEETKKILDDNYSFQINDSYIELLGEKTTVKSMREDVIDLWYSFLITVDFEEALRNIMICKSTIPDWTINVAEVINGPLYSVV